jgi:hypothetical protein
MSYPLPPQNQPQNQPPYGYGPSPHVPVKPVREETTAGRPLAWAAAWGGLGALLSIVAALLLMYLLIMSFVVAVSDDETMGDIFIGLGKIWGSVPPEVLVMVLGVCAVSSVVSMAAVLLLRRSETVRRWRPGVQGLAAAGAAYAFFSVVGPVFGQIVLQLFQVT